MTAIEKQIELILSLNPNYSEMDKIYLTNHLLSLVGDEALNLPAAEDFLKNLDSLVEVAVTNKKIADTLSAKQILEAQIMDLATPSPSQVNHVFWDKYQAGAKRATDWFFNLSKANNYI